VAALAQSAVLPEVDVVLLVAGKTGRIQFYLVRGLSMTPRAGKLGVRSCQGKTGLLAVIELPDVPPVRGVAVIAGLAQGPLVYVIAAVALDAGVASVLVLLRPVTLFAWHGNVQAEKRKARQVVIEADVGVPPFRRVALIALATESACMDIAGAMAADTARGEFLIGERGGVTRMAVNMGVFSEQGPMTVAGMVE
jgi:hypothetical protein